MNLIIKIVASLVTIIFMVLSSSPAWAAKVSKVKGKKLLIELEGETVEKGQAFFILGSGGKKKGILKIVSIKGDKAIASLGKGKATEGDTLLARESSGSSGSSKGKSSSSASEQKSSSTSTMAWGILLGMGMNSMSVDLDITPAQTASLAGSGISYKALFDYALFEKIWFRGTLGMESFAAEGDVVSTACGNAICKVNIQYLTLDFWARYLFSLKTFRSWLGAGFTLWFPMSKETTALEESSITNTSVMAIGGGFDWYMNDKFFVPFQFEYGMLPASEQVSATTIAIRLGIGMNF
jgi:hypothetical protein